MGYFSEALEMTQLERKIYSRWPFCLLRIIFKKRTFGSQYEIQKYVTQ